MSRGVELGQVSKKRRAMAHSSVGQRALRRCPRRCANQRLPFCTARRSCIGHVPGAASLEYVRCRSKRWQRAEQNPLPSLRARPATCIAARPQTWTGARTGAARACGRCRQFSRWLPRAMVGTPIERRARVTHGGMLTRRSLVERRASAASQFQDCSAPKRSIDMTPSRSSTRTPPPSSGAAKSAANIRSSRVERSSTPSTFSVGRLGAPAVELVPNRAVDDRSRVHQLVVFHDAGLPRRTLKAPSGTPSLGFARTPSGSSRTHRTCTNNLHKTMGVCRCCA